MTAAIFVAVEAELQPLLKALALREAGQTAGFPVMRGEVAGREAVVCRTGLGRRAAAAAAAVLDGLRAAAVLSLGTAGGLSPELSAGDLVLCERVSAPPGAGSDEQQPVTAHAGLLAAALEAAERGGVVAGVGHSLTVDAVVWSADEKARLRAQTGCDIVEMESYWVGSAAQRLAIPFLAVRAVSDGAGQTLVDVPGLVREDGTIDYSRLPSYVQQHPEHIPLIAGGAESSRQALAGLERFAAAFLPFALSAAAVGPA